MATRAFLPIILRLAARATSQSLVLSVMPYFAAGAERASMKAASRAPIMYRCDGFLSLADPRIQFAAPKNSSDRAIEYRTSSGAIYESPPLRDTIVKTKSGRIAPASPKPRKDPFISSTGTAQAIGGMCSVLTGENTHFPSAGKSKGQAVFAQS